MDDVTTSPLISSPLGGPQSDDGLFDEESLNHDHSDRENTLPPEDPSEGADGEKSHHRVRRRVRRRKNGAGTPVMGDVERPRSKKKRIRSNPDHSKDTKRQRTENKHEPIPQYENLTKKLQEDRFADMDDDLFMDEDAAPAARDWSSSSGPSEPDLSEGSEDVGRKKRKKKVTINNKRSREDKEDSLGSDREPEPLQDQWESDLEEDSGDDQEAEGMWNALYVSSMTGKNVRVVKRDKRKQERVYREAKFGDEDQDDFFTTVDPFMIDPCLYDLSPVEALNLNSNMHSNQTGEDVYTHEDLEDLERLAQAALEKQRCDDEEAYRQKKRSEKDSLDREATDMKSRALKQRAEEAKIMSIHMIRHVTPFIMAWTTSDSDAQHLPYVTSLKGSLQIGRKLEEEKRHYWMNHQLSIQWCETRGLISRTSGKARGLKNLYKTDVKRIWDVLNEHYPDYSGVIQSLTTTSDKERAFYLNYPSMKGLPGIAEMALRIQDQGSSAASTPEESSPERAPSPAVETQSRVSFTEDECMPLPPSDSDDSDSVASQLGRSNSCNGTALNSVLSMEPHVELLDPIAVKHVRREVTDDELIEAMEMRRLAMKETQALRESKLAERRVKMKAAGILDDEASESDDEIQNHRLRDFILGEEDASTLNAKDQAEVLRHIKERRRKKAEKEEEEDSDPSEVGDLIATTAEELSAVQNLNQGNVQELFQSRLEDDDDRRYRDLFTMKGISRRRANRHRESLLEGDDEVVGVHRRERERMQREQDDVDWDSAETEYSYESLSEDNRDEHRESRRRRKARLRSKALQASELETTLESIKGKMSSLIERAPRDGGTMSTVPTYLNPDNVIQLEFGTTGAIASIAEVLGADDGRPPRLPVVRPVRDDDEHSDSGDGF